MTNPKPFNLELAKQGHPVVTRDGRPVRIICFDVKSKDYPIVGLVTIAGGEESHARYTLKGNYWSSEEKHSDDLFMAPRKVTKWVNFHHHLDDGRITSGVGTYDTEVDARREHAHSNALREYLGAHPVEISL